MVREEGCAAKPSDIEFAHFLDTSLGSAFEVETQLKIANNVGYFDNLNANLEEEMFFMTQDERWLVKYNEVLDFMETNHRNPSRHRIEEQLLLNFIKHNRKLLNAGKLKEPRLSLFKDLLALGEKYKRVNQYW